MSQATSEETLRAVTIGELAILGGPVQLTDYDPRWPALFEREARRIRAALGDRVRLLEHAGSTSVPGLAAKPIIDMVLAVVDSASEEDYVPPMEAAGYVLRIREPEWFEHRLFKGTDPAANIHVFTEGTPEIDRMLVFRDWLRSNDDDRRLYEQTKRDLAVREWKHVQHYADAKTEVVAAIMERALRTHSGRVTGTQSSVSRLRAARELGRQRIARGERPVYHVAWRSSGYGAIDVTIEELPIIHLFVPDLASVLDGARILIARTLLVAPTSVDVVLQDR